MEIREKLAGAAGGEPEIKGAFNLIVYFRVG